MPACPGPTSGLTIRSADSLAPASWSANAAATLAAAHLVIETYRDTQAKAADREGLRDPTPSGAASFESGSAATRLAPTIRHPSAAVGPQQQAAEPMLSADGAPASHARFSHSRGHAGTAITPDLATVSASARMRARLQTPERALLFARCVLLTLGWRRLRVLTVQGPPWRPIDTPERAPSPPLGARSNTGWCLCTPQMARLRRRPRLRRFPCLAPRAGRARVRARAAAPRTPESGTQVLVESRRRCRSRFEPAVVGGPTRCVDCWVAPNRSSDRCSQRGRYRRQSRFRGCLGERPSEYWGRAPGEVRRRLKSRPPAPVEK
jgi:hypothetical protein